MTNLVELTVALVVVVTLGLFGLQAVEEMQLSAECARQSLEARNVMLQNATNGIDTPVVVPGC